MEQALREDNSPIYLIAQKYEIAPNATIVGLTGTPGMEYILSLQLSAKPRRAKMAQGWPSSPEENLERLEKAGLVQDRGIPICSNCGELGHIKKASYIVHHV